MSDLQDVAKDTPETEPVGDNVKTTLSGGNTNSLDDYVNVIQQSNTSIIRLTHIVACGLLELDDEDHEDDEEAETLENLLQALQNKAVREALERLVLPKNYCAYDEDLNHNFVACTDCQINMKLDEIQHIINTAVAEIGKK